MIEVAADVFFLQTANTSYWFARTEHGQLEHLHYGPLLTPQDPAALRVKRTIEHGSSVVYASDDAAYSLDAIPLEYSGIGQGDYRLSPIEAFTASVAADLKDTGVTANVIAPGGPADTRMIAADIPREDLIPADCLADPAVWLSSSLSDGVTGRRYLGARWNRELPPEIAAAEAGAPVAWTGFGVQSRAPKSNAADHLPGNFSNT